MTCTAHVYQLTVVIAVMSAPLAIRHSATLSLCAMCKGVCPSYTMRNELIKLNINLLVLAITLNKGHFDYYLSIVEHLSSCSCSKETNY